MVCLCVKIGRSSAEDLFLWVMSFTSYSTPAEGSPRPVTISRFSRSGFRKRSINSRLIFNIGYNAQNSATKGTKSERLNPNGTSPCRTAPTTPFVSVSSASRPLRRFRIAHASSASQSPSPVKIKPVLRDNCANLIFERYFTFVSF